MFGQTTKNIKQYSEILSAEQIEELSLILHRYNTVRTYIFSRFGSINGLQYLQYPRKIRDEWVKSGFAEQWNLPPKYWKCALEDAFNSIKSNWEATKATIRKRIYRNKNLSDTEKQYCFYVLKANPVLHSILTHKDFDLPQKLSELTINKNKVHSLICRLVRKHKFGISKAVNGRSMMIDVGMYSYKGKTTDIGIQGLKRGKQIRFNTRDKRKWKGNINIIIREDYIEIHKATKVKIKPVADKKNIIGIDKGFCSLIATSAGEDKQYGTGLNKLLISKSNKLSKKNKQRNKLNALLKKHKKNGNQAKVKNIVKFNLGKKKYNSLKQKTTAGIESYINYSLNQFISEQKPSEIVLEDLSFVSWKKKLPKHTNRLLSSWIKGYVQERLNYKTEIFNIRKAVINPAYTSQICSYCGCLGNRSGDKFQCHKCGMGVNADYNASRNILGRKYDNEISLYTPYKRVKEIIQSRVSTLVGSENTTLVLSPPSQAGLEILSDKSIQERIKQIPANVCINL